MRRRSLFQMLMSMPFGFSIAYAQQPSVKIPRVAILSLADSPNDPRWEAFRNGLHEFGYTEGQNVKLEYRLAHGDFDLLKKLTEELANLSVDAIMVDGVASGQAAASMIRTTPIVIAALGADPMALHLADSLARPGHNVTGFTITAPELAVNRVDLLKAAFPAVTAIVVLLNPSKAGAEGLFRLTEKTAHSLGLMVERVEAVNPEALNALSLNTLGRTWRIGFGPDRRDVLGTSPRDRRFGCSGTSAGDVDVPLGHKDDSWSFPHFDTITVPVADAPRPDEILVMAIADGGRLRNRCGTEPIR